jgi:hypothetical protein
MPGMTFHPNDGKRLVGRALYERMLSDQRKWIEQCEQGRSYTGPNGPAIRMADAAELRRIEERLARFPPPPRHHG